MTRQPRPPVGTTTISADAGSGLLVVDKQPGLTSHQVVARVRRLAGTRKVGHAGTLDPMATGVLLVGIERATRLLGHLALTDKSYRATIRLGQSTVTDDAEGDVTAAPGLDGLDPVVLTTAMAALTGEISQVPSAVSAIKVGGVRSYARVRAGEQVTLAARTVTVSRFAVTGTVPADAAGGLPVTDVEVEVDCSTGTYIRALARDLGTALGCGGHLTRLRRTRVGAFDESEAQTLDHLADTELPLITLPALVRRQFATLELDDDQQAVVRHGGRLRGLRLPGAVTALLSGDGSEFLALYRRDGDDAVAEAVFVG